MTDAHITSILALVELFSKAAPKLYDFKAQTVTGGGCGGGGGVGCTEFEGVDRM